MNIIPFIFDTLPVRAVLRDGEPWFVAGDIAAALDYRDAFNMTRILDTDERGTQIVSTPSGDQEMTVISESGLYAAVLKSRKPEAQRFRRWVTGEVLPSIRKTGSYSERHQTYRRDLKTQRVMDVFTVADRTAKARGLRGAAREPVVRAVVEEIAPDLLHLLAPVTPMRPCPVAPGAQIPAQPSPDAALLALVTGWFAQSGNRGRFLVWGVDACTAQQRQRIAGWERETPGGNTVFYILADVFRREVCRGHDHREVLRLLDARGLVIKEGTRPLPGHKDTRRFDTRAKPPLMTVAGGMAQVYRLREGVAGLSISA